MEFSHLDEKGKAIMVDVSEKPVTARRARARGAIYVQESTLNAITENRIAKGDVLATARIAGITAAKRCDELIPLCHSLALDDVSIGFSLCAAPSRIEIESSVSCNAKTGAEMEALVAVSIAALTIYDMVKAVDKKATVGDIRLLEKSGGKSGRFINEESACKGK